MKRQNDPRRPGIPDGAERRRQPQELAVLTRANHDMRSPLSVILGVFELLDEADTLSAGERRYLNLGLKAAGELLTLADSLRLYSSMQRNLISPVAAPVDLLTMARESIDRAITGKPVSVRTIPGAEPPQQALADARYLELALDGLARHLAAHLPEADEEGEHVLVLCQQPEEPGSVALHVSLDCRGSGQDPGAGSGPDADEQEIALINGLRLIELMGGSATVEAGRRLWLTLPAAPGSSDA